MPTPASSDRRSEPEFSMRFELLVATRYLRARRHERFVSLTALISLIGVALGTFALTVVLAVMSGFQEDLRDRLLAFNPHISVVASGANPAQVARLAHAVAAIPGVVGVAPFDESQVMLVATTPAGVPAFVSAGTLRAVVAANNPVLTELRRTLTDGSLAALDATYPVTVNDHGANRVVQLPGAIIGRSMADDLG